MDSEKRTIGGERQHGSMGKKQQQQQQQHKKGSKKPITGRNSTETGSVIGLGALATALEAEEAWKPSKGLKERRKNSNNNRPMTPNPNMPETGNGSYNNTYNRPASRRTTTTMTDQRKGSLHSPGAMTHMGGEQRKALKWLGLA